MSDYIFPNFLAKAMAKVDMRTQYEASMWSMVLIMGGLIASGIYFSIYMNFALWYKIFLNVNVVAGLVFLSSNLVTTYQQYKSYMSTMEFQKSMKGGNMK